MKFIINTTNLQSGGALQVAISLLAEWRLHFEQHEFHVFLSPQMETLVERTDYPSNFFFYSFKTNPAKTFFTAFTLHRQFSSLEQQIKPDAVFTVFGPALWKPQSPHLVGFANGYYLFDDSRFIQEKILSNFFQRIKYQCRRVLVFKQFRREGTKYWVETASAQERLAKTINRPTNDISVIGNTYNNTFEQPGLKVNRNSAHFRLLYLSAYYAHKNFETIPQVIVLLKERNIACTFTLSLPHDKFAALYDGTNHGSYLENIGPVAADKAYEAYQNTNAVFMPSLLETFSANYPEAMISQKPILTSQLSFAQDICGDAALYFDPESAGDIADKIALLISDTALQQQLIEAGNKRLLQMETPVSRATKLIRLLEEVAQIKTKVK